MTTTNAATHTLRNYQTGEAIRPATDAELAASMAAEPEGVILVDGVACYVD